MSLADALLFVIFINDCFRIHLSGSITVFVDDASVLEIAYASYKNETNFPDCQHNHFTRQIVHNPRFSLIREYFTYNGLKTTTPDLWDEK